MFNVTKEDIKLLEDDDLRALVALLCDAELAQQNISNAGVTRGGHQDASDGGIDVRVSIESMERGDGYIPRSNTCFQVKKPNLGVSDIWSEMCPGGVLRPAIAELAETDGAYIIASSGANLTDSKLKGRVHAMKDALGGLGVHVDYYDQDRLRNWTNNHLSLVYWVKERLGNPVKGWRPFGKWAGSTGSDDQYFIDDELLLRRLVTSKSSENDSLKGVSGLEIIRSILRTPQSIVRLVGLSGVGKTRFAQALFEREVGKYALPATIAVYADIGDDPIPRPRDLLAHLSLLGRRVILILDNCGKDLHRSLADKLAKENTQVSLLTIEYDVRENLPPSTEAFQLEPASDTLISQVLKNRFSHLGYAITKGITGLSGGNYRIALLLAEQIEENENVTEITDTVLFERLFRQDNATDHTLLKVAEALSIVYSFDFSSHAEDSEIGTLGSLIGISPTEVYSYVAELKRRNLIQARSHWRAVLPHALANRLARQCLENIPIGLIENLISRPSNFRLLKSVSRRLNYLKDHDAAYSLTKNWCSPGNILSEPFSFDRDRIEILKNITSIHEDTVLDLLEESTSNITQLEYNDFRHRKEFIKIITYIAYQPLLFKRSVLLLFRCYSLEQDSREKRNLRETISRFFQIMLSGTNATTEQRIIILRKTWLDDAFAETQLAQACLSASLQVGQFYGHPIFDYDQARKDYGYHPREEDEIENWFHSFIELILELYLIRSLEGPVRVLANRFRALWKATWLRDFLVETVQKIISKGSWIHGWVAIGEALQYDRKEMGSKAVKQLEVLFKKLQPDDLYDQIRVYVLMEAGDIGQEITGTEKDRSRSRDEINGLAEDLGLAIGNDLELLQTIIIKLLHCRVPNSLYAFGLGVGKQCSIQNRDQLWQIILDGLNEHRETLVYTLFVQGFITGTRTVSPSFVEMVLDNITDDPNMIRYLPALQGAAGYDKRGIQRLLLSLESNKVPIRAYSELAYERNTITNTDLIKILEKVLARRYGIFICIDVLNFRVNKNDLYASDNADLLEFVFTVIEAYDFSSPKPDWHHDGPLFDLKRLIDKCFATPLAYRPSVVLLNNFKSYFHQRYSRPKYLEYIIEVLLKHQPLAVLDTLVDVELISESYWEDFRQIRNFALIISALPNKLLLEWCQQGSIERYHRLARYINPIDNKLATINYEKWVELVTTLTTMGQEDKVLSAISSSLFSSHGRGLSIFGLSTYRTFLSRLIEAAPDLEEWINKEQDEIRKVWKVLNSRDEDWENDHTPQSFE